MVITLRHWWQETRSSFWFVPATIVLGAVALAAALIEVDASVKLNFVARWPLFFGAGADGARGLLTAVASSMITVAGVVFSITIVALSLTSSQYTSRVLRNFMRDAVNQAVLGVFVGIFAYCLVVLRTIRGGDQGAFVPSLAVLVGLILAFVGIGFLIYFIHHIALSIQAASIIAAAAEESFAAVDHLFPEGLGDSPDDNADEDAGRGPLPSLADETWKTVLALNTGYIESVDIDALLTLACECKTVLRMEHGVGEFVIMGTPLLSAAGDGEVNDKFTSKLNAAYIVGRQRSVQQDAGFGIRQIVDIALKALSPGINDSTTAVMCVDYLTAILVRLAARDIPSHYRIDKGEVRLIARGPTFESLLAESFDQIRQNAEGNVAVLTRLIEAVETISCKTAHRGRQRALRRHIEAFTATAERTIPSSEDRIRLRSRLERLPEGLKPNAATEPSGTS